MGSIQINLIPDMVRIMRRELEEIGYKVNITDNRELMMCYFTTCKRIVKAVPRNVHEAEGLVVPPSRRAGYDALKAKFERGESVMQHMSKQIRGLKFQDKMLFDWGIHHFHLDTTIEADGFVRQHNEIVYAIVDDSDVYVIAVLDHEHWADKNLLEVVLANWSHLLEPYRITGKPVLDFDSKGVEKLREANVNTVLTLSDGFGYMGRGMGLTSVGTSSDAVLDTIRMQKDLTNIEIDVKNKFFPKDNEHLLFGLSRTPEGIFLEEPHIGYVSQIFNFASLKRKLS